MQHHRPAQRTGLRSARVSALLGGVSVLALCVSAAPVEARGGVTGLARGIVPTQAAQAAATAAARQAAQAAQQAETSMARAAAGLALMRQAQQAAAAMAAQGNVPNGIVNGGLMPQGGVTAAPKCTLFCTYQLKTTDTTLWEGADAPQQLIDNSGNYLVNINQTQQKAILNWDSFSIGRKTTLNFLQGGSDWIAFNRVNDATTAPSQILGSMNALGSIYVVNRNGIIFGGGSQVNVHSLIASDLDVGRLGMSRGDRDKFFRDTGIAGNGDASKLSFYNTFDLTQPVGNSAGDKVGGGVYVQPGAKITASLLTGDMGGGSIYLFGVNVYNEGTLTASGGRVALVAAQAISLTPLQTLTSTLPKDVVVDPDKAPNGIRGDGFLIQQYSDLYSTDGNSLPTGTFSYRAGTGSVVNGGLIETPRGTVVMNGDTISIDKLANINIANLNALTTPDVNRTNVTLTNLGADGQLNPNASVYGVISADTSITRNSMVLLDAATSVDLKGIISIQPFENGETLPTGSSSGSTVAKFLPAYVGMTAQNLVSVGSSGLISAPSAYVSLQARNSTSLSFSANGQVNGRLGTQRQVVLAGTNPADPANQPGAVIDVAGLQNVELPASYNFVQFQPRGGEFADMPLQRGGVLFNQNMWIDIRASGTRADGSTWYGTPVGDASGVVNAVGRSISQLMTKGGSVSLDAGITANLTSQVIQQAGSVVNVAGGKVTFLPGMVSATYLIGVNGRIYSMINADPNVQYAGIAGGTVINHERWNLTESFSSFNQSYQAGYTEGNHAGSVAVTAVAPQLGGTMYFGSAPGERQIASNAKGDIGSYPRDKMPFQGSLTLNLPTSVVIGQGGNLASTSLVTPGSAINGQNFVTQSQYQTVLSADALSSFGLSTLEIKANDLLVTHNPTNDIAGLSDLSLASGGEFKATVGGAIDIAGRVSSHGGKITFQTDRGSQLDAFWFKAPKAPSGAALASNVYVGGTLDVSGTFVNDASGSAPVGGAYIDGGTISISTTRRSDENFNDATGSILLAAGSVLDASSGAYVARDGKTKMSAPGVMAGAGGAIQLFTYLGANFVAPDASGGPTVPRVASAATIQLGGTLRAYGFKSNGSLSIAGVKTMRIGGTPQPGDGIYFPVCGSCLVGGGGFGAYTFSSMSDLLYGDGNLVVAAGTNLTLQQQNLSSAADYRSFGTGTQIGAVAPRTAGLGVDQRQAIDLTFRAANILLDTGSRIETDPGAAITFSAAQSTTTAAGMSVTSSAATNVLLRGNILDHSGTVTVNASHIWFGARANIDLSGTVIANSLFGARTATGLSATTTPGGTLILDAVPGTPVSVLSASNPSLAGSFVVAEAGAKVDVSGYSGPVTLKDHFSGITTMDAWSDAGTVSINSGAFVWGGTIVGLGGRSPVSGAADPRAKGGTFILGGGYDSTNGGPVILSNDSNSILSGLAAATKPTSASSLTSLASLGLGQFNGKVLAAVDKITGTDAAPTGFENIFLYSGVANGGAARIFTDLSLNTYGIIPPNLGALTIAGSLDWRVASRLHIAASQINAGSSTGSNVSIQAPYVVLTGGGSSAGLNPGSNRLTITAQTIDVEGAAFSGFGAANGSTPIQLISSGDIRLSTPKVANGQGQSSGSVSDPARFAGKLAAGGDLLLQAQRIYPVSAVDFTIQTSGNVTFASPAGSRTDLPLSAGGSLTVSAKNIKQQGNLFAPLGKITLGDASTDTVSLEPGSLTSVTLADTTVPYGSTQEGTNWYYNSTVSPLATPPAKGVALIGKNVETKSGSTIDLRGGGDLQAMEWIAGKGGSLDALTGVNGGLGTASGAGPAVYALLPTQNDPVAAFDVHFTAAKGANASGQSGVQFQLPSGRFVYVQSGDPYPLAGTQIHLNGGNGIQAGTYTLYPAHYATLPGALKVTYYGSNLVNKTPSGTTLPDGTVLVSGYYTQSTRPGVQSFGQEMFAVQTGAVWKQYSEYSFNDANSYFIRNTPAGGTVPRLPMDAGRLSVVPTTSLLLAATALTKQELDGNGKPIAYDSGGNRVDPSSSNVFRTAAVGELDISASQLSVVSAASDADPGRLAVTLDQLNRFGSVLIGGSRNDLGVIDAKATDVILDTRGKAFTGPELLLVATNTGAVTVRTGSVVDTSQSVGTPSAGRSYTSTTVGALFAATNDPNLAVSGATTAAAGGTVTVQGGTRITTATLTLQGTKTTGAVILNNNAALDVNQLNLAGATVGIGASVTDSVQLTTTNAAQLAGVRNLALRAFSGDITFYKNAGETAVNFIQPGLQSLRLDGRAITGTGGDVNVQIGGKISLVNGSGATGTSAVQGRIGTLNLDAKQIELGGGIQAVTGFNAINFKASERLYVAKSGALQAGVVTVSGSAGPNGKVSVSQQRDLVLTSGVAANALTFDTPVIVTTPAGARTVHQPQAQIPALAAGSMITPLGDGTMTLGTTASVSFTTTALKDVVDVKVTTPNILVGGATSIAPTLQIGTPSAPSTVVATSGAFRLATLGTFTTQGVSALASTDDVGKVGFGGNLVVDASAIALGSALQAESGTVMLHATSGDITLASGAYLAARGYAKALFDQTRYSPGGKVTLQADTGAVTALAGSTIDVSQPAGGRGYGGDLNVIAAGTGGTVTLNGTLLGGGGPGLGGRIKIASQNALDLNALAGLLAPSGFTGAIDVRTRTGSLSLSQGNTLTANTVVLTADDRSSGKGVISIAGTINANGYDGDTADGTGQAGGQVGLFGANAVTLTGTGKIIARTAHRDERGGDVTIGIGPTATGAIDLQAGSLIDVSGGTKGGLSGGTLLLRAPLIADVSGVAGRGDVAITRIASTIIGARSVTVQPYVTFSTNSSIDGVGLTVPGWDGNVDPGGAVAGTAGAAAHVSFFTSTLKDFVQGSWTFGGKSYGFDGTLNRLVKPLVATLGPDGASIVRLQPGVDLVNPDTNINGGNITVASNWNLASGTARNSSGVSLRDGDVFDLNSTAVQFNYRLVSNYGTAAAPNLVVNPGALTMRATNNINVNASISDGFFQFGDYTNANYITAVRTYLRDLGTGATSRRNGIDPVGSGLLYYLNAAGSAVPVATYKVLGNAASPSSVDIVGSDLFPHTLIACTGACTGSNRITLTDPGSWSYQFAAGANLTSANPAAIKTQVAGDVVLKGTPGIQQPNPNATEFFLWAFNPSANNSLNNAQISTYFSTMVRTGTGNIGIFAAGDVKLSDLPAANTAAPGVIYAAGVQTPKLTDPGYALSGPSSSQTVRPSYTADDAFLEPRLLAYNAIGVSNFLASQGVQLAFGPPTAAAFPYKGGDVTVQAQRDVIGIGDASALSRTSCVTCDANPATASSTSQLFAPWLMSLAGITPVGQNQGAQANLVGAGVFAPFGNKAANQTAWWIQYNSFQQGILSAGGNVDVNAGRNIVDVSVSLPTTGRVSGGIVPQSSGVLSTPVTHMYDSGNMTVRAGGSIFGGAFYEGSGHAVITARGSVGTAANNTVKNPVSFASSSTVPDVPLLAVDSGRIALTAAGSITFAGVVNPAELHVQAGNFADPQSLGSVAVGVSMDTYGPNSGVNLASLAGDVTIRPTPTYTRYGRGGNNTNATLYPASLQVAALGGSIITQDMFNNPTSRQLAGSNPGIHLSASPNGVFELLAAGSVDLTGGYTSDLRLLPNNIPTVPTFSAGPALFDAAFDPYRPNSGFAQPLNRPTLAHSTVSEDEIARIYAVTGNITAVGSYASKANNIDAFNLYRRVEINRPSVVRAGKDIVDLNLIVQNIGPDSVSTVSAGGDIRYTGLYNAGGLQVAGPGYFVVQAGGNIGPFLPSSQNTKDKAKVQEGIVSVGNTSDTPVGNMSATPTRDSSEDPGQSWRLNNVTGIYNPALLGNFATVPKKRNELLSSTGASIITLFGVKFGIDYQSVINAYIDPTVQSGVAHKYTEELKEFLRKLGIVTSDPWTAYLDLPRLLPQGKDLQQIFVDQVFFAELKAVGIEGSHAFNKPSFGYRMIETMFPSRLGYTANIQDGNSAGGARSMVQTGDLNILHGTIQTQHGGDISMFGPGGSILVGSLAPEPNPNFALRDIGILSLGGGAINSFTDGSLLVNSSRVLTVLGGDIVAWSSNGDLNAGRGARTALSLPPLKVTADTNDYQTVDASGLVSGSGIGTLQSTSFTNTAAIYLFAPRGIIDAGDAGIRASGSAFFIAPVIANLGSITVSGNSNLPAIQVPNFGAITSATNTAGSQRAGDAPTAGGSRDQASIFLVEVIGYGGGDGSAGGGAGGGSGTGTPGQKKKPEDN